MLCAALAEASSYLDNYAAHNTMHRQRVKTGTNQDGGCTYRWVQGATHDDLNDAIVKAYIESGRIYEFMRCQTGKPGKPDVPFKQVAELWMNTYKTALKETSKRDYRYILDKLLYPTFMDIPVQSVTITGIQGFLNSHPSTAKSTLRKCVIVLDQIFSLAVREEITGVNPVDKKFLKYPSDIVQERQALSCDAFKSILANIPAIQRQDDRRFIAILALTGMRRGEALALRWEDIDFQEKTIRVSRNVTYPDNNPIVGTPKSKSGFRVIPLDDRLSGFLAPFQSSGYILGGERPPTKSSFTKMWSRISRQIDLHGATPHIFRHTYATLLNGAGVPIKTIQSILGHADISTTMNVYTHCDLSSVQNARTGFASFTA